MRSLALACSCVSRGKESKADLLDSMTFKNVYKKIISILIQLKKTRNIPIFLSFASST